MPVIPDAESMEKLTEVVAFAFRFLLYSMIYFSAPSLDSISLTIKSMVLVGFR